MTNVLLLYTNEQLLIEDIKHNCKNNDFVKIPEKMILGHVTYFCINLNSENAHDLFKQIKNTVYSANEDFKEIYYYNYALTNDPEDYNKFTNFLSQNKIASRTYTITWLYKQHDGPGDDEYENCHSLCVVS